MEFKKHCHFFFKKILYTQYGVTSVTYNRHAQMEVAMSIERDTLFVILLRLAKMLRFVLFRPFRRRIQSSPFGKSIGAKPLLRRLR